MKTFRLKVDLQAQRKISGLLHGLFCGFPLSTITLEVLGPIFNANFCCQGRTRGCLRNLGGPMFVCLKQAGKHCSVLIPVVVCLIRPKTRPRSVHMLLVYSSPSK